AEGISLPDPNLSDDAYFQAVATLFASPELLPNRLTEALHAVQEMSDPQCRDQINTALAALQSSTLPRQSEAAAGPSLPVLHPVSPKLYATAEASATEDKTPPLQFVRSPGRGPPTPSLSSSRSRPTGKNSSVPSPT